jgi:hypothetical protein
MSAITSGMLENEERKNDEVVGISSQGSHGCQFSSEYNFAGDLH